MSYFTDHYRLLGMPINTDGDNGLRRAQIGAAYAVAAHFTLNDTPAMVVMPTGSGKTAVLISVAYLLRAERVLVVTPSVLLRGQIAEQFRTLRLMRLLGVLPDDVPCPVVREVRERVTTLEQWEALREADVVVATTQSISPALEDVVQPPGDLFDLLLIDEAHHSPAKTWDAVLKGFPLAKRVLTTATPFRRDKSEIKGKVVYNYSLRSAYNDRVFGQVEFVAVNPGNADHDVQLAIETEAVLAMDREAGYNHLVMVRTDTKTRGKDLLQLYSEHTNLRLQIVDSDHSLQHTKSVIARLTAGELDGVVCVDMMGEGFDLPNLKIAAIHSPHKSLGITLQFIGRFARTNAPDVGTAKFLAIPSEIEGETSVLYKDDAIWQDIIIDLSEQRVADEVAVREVLDRFDRPDITIPETEDVSLYALEPAKHVKVYRVGGDFDMNASINLPSTYEVVWKDRNPDDRVLILITRQTEKPRWTRLKQFERTECDLFVLYYDQPSGLLFIGASTRAEDLYELIARSVCPAPRRLPLYQLDRVLADLAEPEFFNIGMKNSVLNDNTESYRIITGGSAQSAVLPKDGESYHRGHVFGRATLGDEPVTIGYSSSSRIWSSSSTSVPGFVDWCKWLAGQLSQNRVAHTNTGLDYLKVGVELTQLPEDVIAVDWHEDEYVRPHTVHYTADGGRPIACLTVDMGLSIDYANSSARSIRVIVEHNTSRWELDFSLETHDFFTSVPLGAGANMMVECGGRRVPLVEHINSYPLSFYLSDMSRFCMSEHFPFLEGRHPVLDPNCIEAVDWAAARVDIQAEIRNPADGMLTIQSYVNTYLCASDAEVVFCDHTTGEIADFLTFRVAEDSLKIGLFHCKGSSQPLAGHRDRDLYEVMGQVCKCVGRIKNRKKLLGHVRHRFANTQLPEFRKGDEALLTDLFARAQTLPAEYEIVVVQPGISKNRLPDRLARIIASANDYVTTTNSGRLRIMASA